MKMALVLIALISAPLVSLASQDSCEKSIYKDGWIKKYDHLGNTWGANTAKHGVVSSSIGSSVEKSTSSVDPGVSTGRGVSVSQYSSSWGECSLLDLNYVRMLREEYIEQNLGEIKKQIALGSGNHVDSLAAISGCGDAKVSVWSRSLQQNVGRFYDIQNGSAFAKEIDAVIVQTPGLKGQCYVDGLI